MGALAVAEGHQTDRTGPDITSAWTAHYGIATLQLALRASADRGGAGPGRKSSLP